MKFERLEATADATVGFCGPAKHVGGSLPRVLREGFTQEQMHFLPQISDLFLLQSSSLCKTFRHGEWGRKKSKSKLSLFLGLGSPGQPPTDSSYRFYQMVFLFHLLKVCFKKERKTEVLPRKEYFFFFLMGKNTQLYLGTE